MLLLIDGPLALSFLLNIWSYHQNTVKMSPRTASTLDIIAYGLESATTIFVTLLVVARLLYVRRRHIKLIGKAYMIFYDSPTTFAVQENQTLPINI